MLFQEPTHVMASTAMTSARLDIATGRYRQTVATSPAIAPINHNDVTFWAKHVTGGYPAERHRTI